MTKLGAGEHGEHCSLAGLKCSGANDTNSAPLRGRVCSPTLFASPPVSSGRGKEEDIAQITTRRFSTSRWPVAEEFQEEGSSRRERGT
jgi:hypothetical protein